MFHDVSATARVATLTKENLLPFDACHEKFFVHLCCVRGPHTLFFALHWMGVVDGLCGCYDSTVTVLIMRSQDRMIRSCAYDVRARLHFYEIGAIWNV